MSGFSDMGYIYDSRPTVRTTAAICAAREVSWRPSFYRGEQFDADLGLYYLRARYYNPLTGRFISRDPNEPELFQLDGYPTDPRALHKYLYAGGDPINAKDPTGRDLYEYFFARRTGLLNTNGLIRLGEGWNNVIKCVVFRLAIGSASAAIHIHWDWWIISCP